MLNSAQLMIVYDGHEAKEGDDLFKKLKREAEKAMPGFIAVMHNSEERFKPLGTTVKLYPYGQLYHLGLGDTELLVTALKDGTTAAEKLLHKGLEPVALESKSDSLFRLLLENINFTKTRICGKCCPCRLGGPRIASFLEQFERNLITNEAVAQLYNVAFAMQKASMCAVGMFGADPLLFSLKEFNTEFRQKVAK